MLQTGGKGARNAELGQTREPVVDVDAGRSGVGPPPADGHERQGPRLPPQGSGAASPKGVGLEGHVCDADSCDCLGERTSKARPPAGDKRIAWQQTGRARTQSSCEPRQEACHTVLGAAALAAFGEA